MKTPPDTKYLITDLKSARKNTLKKSYFKTRIFFKKNNIGKLQCVFFGNSDVMVRRNLMYTPQKNML